MKKLLFFIGLFLITSVSSYSQLTINQTYSPTANLKVGDTITVAYNVAGASRARYVWLRYQYNTNAMTMVPNSTSFAQGTSSQTYFYEWTNYKFTANANSAATDLYAQYNTNPWNYVVTQGSNVAQLSVQRTDKAVSGVLATQKFVLKDVADYANTHKLDLAYALDSAAGAMLTDIKTTQSTLSLGTVTGATSAFTVKVLYPSTYTYINQHKVQLMKLKTDGTIDWSQQPIAVGSLDASGTATFYNGIKIGDSLGVFISPAYQQAFMSNIVTVSDAYKAFLGHSQTDISGTPNYFTRPTFEKKIGLVTKANNTFSESDSYYLFAYVMGQDISAKARYDTKTDITITTKNSLFIDSVNGVLEQKYFQILESL